MSIVARGLAKGAGALVAFGLGLSVTVVVPDRPVQPSARGDYSPGQYSFKRAEVKLGRLAQEYVLGRIAASGSAEVRLLKPDQQVQLGLLSASGQATSAVVMVQPHSKLGQLVAEGRKDISDEELLSMLVSLAEEE